MKIQRAAFSRTLLAILILGGGGAALDSLADGFGSGSVLINCSDRHDSTVGFNFNLFTNNESFGTFDNWHWSGNISSSGSYAYADLERFIAGGYVYHTLHIAGAAIYYGYPEFGSAESQASLYFTEWMLIQYVPASETDTPPTSVSFQFSYVVQGQMQIEMDNWFIQADNWITSGNTFNDLGITIPISTNVVSSVITQPLNQAFTIQNGFYSGVVWEGGLTNSEPSTYDLQYIFQGFVNIVDQNGQTIPASKLKFLCVNSSDTTQQVPFASEPNLAVEQAVTLEAVPGTNSLILQWPSYASNYQLQMTPGLGNAAWTTNGSPPPVVSGPFLQVTVPTTNAAAFFRLLQTN